MRILLHDYAGHPFTVHLARALAKRGHEVLYVYSASVEAPQGKLENRPNDSDGLQFFPIILSETIRRINFVQRFRLEHQYASRLDPLCQKLKPDVILSGNTPSIIQHRLARHCRKHHVRLVSWIQDIYGIAAYRILKKKIPGLGHAIGKYFMALDRSDALASDALVLISNDFKPIFARWGISPDKIRVIHNWSVLEEIPLRPRENQWSNQNQITDGPRFFYSGTLSMKHNPALLLELAKMLEKRGEGELVVVSEGSGIEWLEREADAIGLKTLRCLGFQPFEMLADVLGSADILLAVLEPDAGVFSVPSKILSYMCAGRAILGAIPENNLASRIITEHGLGIVVAPDDVEKFCQAAVDLINSPERRREYGEAARRYAEENFDIDRITSQFEELMNVSSSKFGR